jgi:Arc/MetJ family transcription regulator
MSFLVSRKGAKDAKKQFYLATNVKIDEKLIQEALQLGGHRTKRAVIEEALQEYVQRRKQLEVIKLFGTIEYDDDYDYKLQRQ